jgi:hypothetical protein
MGVGKKVQGGDGCESWRSAKLVHANWEGGDEPMKGCFSRHQCINGYSIDQVLLMHVDDSARRGGEPGAVGPSADSR